jgi:hypothetical protein
MRIGKTLLITALVIAFFSCQDILEVTDISDKNVQLVAPSDSTTVVQTNVRFTWEAIFEATRYHIQVATPNFENPSQIVVDTLIVIDSTFVGLRLNKTLANSTYQWRVKALNSDFETDFSASFFTVNAPSN